MAVLRARVIAHRIEMAQAELCGIISAIVVHLLLSGME